MDTKRLTLTAFFIALTLSIGLVSVNLPLSSYAQNSALSQSGNNHSEQETEQEQSSTQDNQVVSGDSSVLSGNNLSCQGQSNSKIVVNPDNLCAYRSLSNEPIPTTLFVHVENLVTDSWDKPCAALITFTDETEHVTFTNCLWRFDSIPYHLSVNNEYSLEVKFRPQVDHRTIFSGPCQQVSADKCLGRIITPPHQVNIFLGETGPNPSN